MFRGKFFYQRGAILLKTVLPESDFVRLGAKSQIKHFRLQTAIHWLILELKFVSWENNKSFSYSFYSQIRSSNFFKI